jgi:alkylation response protein AidB-like acyl-CoA dehydrogenase
MAALLDKNRLLRLYEGATQIQQLISGRELMKRD